MGSRCFRCLIRLRDSVGRVLSGRITHGEQDGNGTEEYGHYPITPPRNRSRALGSMRNIQVDLHGISDNHWFSSARNRLYFQCIVKPEGPVVADIMSRPSRDSNPQPLGMSLSGLALAGARDCRSSDPLCGSPRELRFGSSTRTHRYPPLFRRPSGFQALGGPCSSLGNLITSRWDLDLGGKKGWVLGICGRLVEVATLCEYEG